MKKRNIFARIVAGLGVIIVGVLLNSSISPRWNLLKAGCWAFLMLVGLAAMIIFGIVEWLLDDDNFMCCLISCLFISVCIFALLVIGAVALAKLIF